MHLTSGAEIEAACVLVSVKATTAAGVAALLQHAIAADTDGQAWPADLESDDGKRSRSWHYFLVENLAESFASIVPAMPCVASSPPTQPAPPSRPDDSALLELEEKIFEQHAAAREYDDEIERLGAIVRSEGRRLYEEALAAEVRQERYITPQERWERVLTMPECEEEERLNNLQSVHILKMEDLIRTMWAIPARTPEGRRAKVLVLLGTIMPERLAGD